MKLYIPSQRYILSLSTSVELKIEDHTLLVFFTAEEHVSIPLKKSLTEESRNELFGALLTQEVVNLDNYVETTTEDPPNDHEFSEETLKRFNEEQTKYEKTLAEMELQKYEKEIDSLSVDELLQQVIAPLALLDSELYPTKK